MKKKEDKRGTEGDERKTRRYAQKRDLSIVRSSDDDPMSDRIARLSQLSAGRERKLSSLLSVY